MSAFLQTAPPAPPLHDDDAPGIACVDVLTVGESTSWVGERIVEIAIATNRGLLLTTVVNPRMDLYTAHVDHGLTTRDVQLAPTLSEAWPVIEQAITGHVLVGIDPVFLSHALARELRDIDADTVPGLILPFDPFTLSPSARRDFHVGEPQRSVIDMLAHPEAVTASPDDIRLARYVPTGRRRPGYLMNRTPPSPANMLGGSVTVGGELGGNTPEQTLAVLLARAWERVVDPDRALVDRIRAIEDECRIGILPRYYELPGRPDPMELLASDPVITVSGWIAPARTRSLSSDVLKAVLERLGLRTSDSVLSRNVAVHVPQRERQDLLLVAERGSQSRKVKNAAQHGVPIMTVYEFLECVATHPLPEPIAARALTAPPPSVADIPRWLEEETDFVLESDWE